MAFRPLTEADCGAPNALVQLTSHLTTDHGFSETAGHAFPSNSDQLVEQFLRETQPVPQSYNMNDLMREMQEIESQKFSLPPVPAPPLKEQIQDKEWALQYIEDGGHFNVNSDHDAVWAQINAHEQSQNEDQVDPDFHLRDSTATGAFWEEQFFEENEEAETAKESANDLLDGFDEPQLEYSKFMKFMKQVGDGDATIDGGEVSWGEEASAWGKEYLSGLKEEGAKSLPVQDNETYNSSFWERLQDEWKKLSDQQSQEHPWLNEYNDYYYDMFKNYNFTEENPMFDIVNPLERGKEMLSQGDWPSAVLCFEAAVKKEPDNAEAWQLLGTTQAENEQDPNAICALKRCVELDPKNATALMALAVSYTNESYPRQACQSLLQWMKQHPEYGQLVPPDLNLHGQVSSMVRQQELEIMTDLFLKAAQRRPRDIDYEVQCGLGVLFNLSSEYNKAADCFKAALGVKPDDAKLWNRLGATLANGNRAEEAVDAYHKALNLEPGFIRARYNVGITCINLSAYKEAAEHFLIALNQQALGKDVANQTGCSSQMSDTIWSTLRMCVSLMNRPDVRDAVDARDLATLNKTFDVRD